jgi:hypothetical protein
MAATADPHEALMLFQPALFRREIPLQHGTVDRELYCCIDHPDGKARLSYMRIEGETLTALVMLVQQFSFWFLWLGCWLGERRASRRSDLAVTVEEAAVLQRRG